MIVVVPVGALVVPLICQRCGWRVLVVVGDEASEAKGEAEFAAHQCVPKDVEVAS